MEYGGSIIRKQKHPSPLRTIQQGRYSSHTSPRPVGISSVWWVPKHIIQMAQQLPDFTSKANTAKGLKNVEIRKMPVVNITCQLDGIKEQICQMESNIVLKSR